MGDSPISLSSLFRNHLEVKCHKHNFGQSGCFCKGQSDLSLLCLCCPMGVAQWKWLPWRIKLVLMEKCVGFRPQHSQHESNTIRHSRLGSGWDFELVFDCTVRPMNPRSKSCHLKFRSRWRLTTQYTNIYIYMWQVISRRICCQERCFSHFQALKSVRNLHFGFIYPENEKYKHIVLWGWLLVDEMPFRPWATPKSWMRSCPAKPSAKGKPCGESYRVEALLKKHIYSYLLPSNKILLVRYIWKIHRSMGTGKSPNHCLQPRAQAGPGGKVCSGQNRSRKVISSGSELQETWDHKCPWFVEVWAAQTFHHGSHPSECGGRGIFHAAGPSDSSNSKMRLKAERLHWTHWLTSDLHSGRPKRSQRAHGSKSPCAI